MFNDPDTVNVLSFGLQTPWVRAGPAQAGHWPLDRTLATRQDCKRKSPQQPPPSHPRMCLKPTSLAFLWDRLEQRCPHTWGCPLEAREDECLALKKGLLPPRQCWSCLRQTELGRDGTTATDTQKFRVRLCLQHHPRTLNKRALKKLFFLCFLPLGVTTAVPKWGWEKSDSLMMLLVQPFCSYTKFSEDVRKKRPHTRICKVQM